MTTGMSMSLSWLLLSILLILSHSIQCSLSNVERFLQAQQMLSPAFQWTNCSVSQTHFTQLTTSHDYLLTANLYGTWRFVANNTSILEGGRMPCPHALQIEMVAATADVMKETLMGLSLDLIYGNETYETRLWGLASQKLTASYFEMLGSVDVSNETLSISNQLLFVAGRVENGTNTAVKPPDWSGLVLRNKLVRKKFFGTNLIVTIELLDLLALYVADQPDNSVNVKSLPTLPQLIAEGAPTGLRLGMMALRYKSPLSFPLARNTAVGVNAIFFRKVLSINDDYESVSLRKQRSFINANYAISAISVSFNAICVLIVFSLLVYYHNTQPRASRGYLPYLILVQMCFMLTRIAMQSYYGEDYLLLLFMLLSMGTLGFAYVLYFLNTLLYFYKRKVYHDIYVVMKRESYDAKKGSNSNTPGTPGTDSALTPLTPTMMPPRGSVTGPHEDVAKEEGAPVHYKRPSLKFVKSKWVKVVAVVLSLTFVVVVYSAIIPIAVLTTWSVFATSVQVLLGVFIALAFLCIFISFAIDMVWNWKYLIKRCEWKKYFFTKDPNYFRMELVLYILSVVLLLITSFVKVAIMARVDNIPMLASDEYTTHVALATFLVLPIELVALFVEICAAGGGFICFATLYERIRLSNQSESALEQDVEMKNRRSRDSFEGMNFQKKRTPFLHLLGEELSRLFLDDAGFSLIRTYSKSEFSVENVAILHDLERIYSLLYRENPFTGESERLPVLNEELSPNDFERARKLLCEDIYKLYVSDFCRMSVNFSNMSKKYFAKWVNLKSDEWSEQYFKSKEFITDFEFVILDVVKNIKDTFCRLKLTPEYQIWLSNYKQPISRHNSREVQPIPQQQFLTV